MEGKREEIRKGPWKAEEDQVLLNHVHKYGPRDWSSIRSKGLLQRTGKSCRLRWVNKLRPNLKNGCKFSAEEERIVIELQAQFGNKWARIATYLPGRTDNDVKNFWSSRQKRLARILHNSSATSSASTSKSHRTTGKKEAPLAHDIVPCLEVPNIISAQESSSSSKPMSCSPSFPKTPEPIKMVPLPDLVKPDPLAFSTNLVNNDHLTQTQTYPLQSQIAFPVITQSQSSIPFSPESQELLSRLDDPYFYDILGPMDASGLVNNEQLNLCETFFDPVRSCQNAARGEPDAFLDDFPADLFDQVESVRDSPD